MKARADVVPAMLADVFAVSMLPSVNVRSSLIALKIVKVFEFFSSVNPSGSSELILVLVDAISEVTCREYDIIIDINILICALIAPDTDPILNVIISSAVVLISEFEESWAIKIIKLRAFCKKTSADISDTAVDNDVKSTVFAAKSTLLNKPREV